MTRRLRTQYNDPLSIETILANRLIPLDKEEGTVWPTGVREVIRRVMGMCVIQVTKRYVIDASSSLHACAGYKSGSEAASMQCAVFSRHMRQTQFCWLMHPTPLMP